MKVIKNDYGYRPFLDLIFHCTFAVGRANRLGAQFVFFVQIRILSHRIWRCGWVRSVSVDLSASDCVAGLDAFVTIGAWVLVHCAVAADAVGLLVLAIAIAGLERFAIGRARVGLSWGGWCGFVGWGGLGLSGWGSLGLIGVGFGCIVGFGLLLVGVTFASRLAIGLSVGLSDWLSAQFVFFVQIRILSHCIWRCGWVRSVSVVLSASDCVGAGLDAIVTIGACIVVHGAVAADAVGLLVLAIAIAGLESFAIG